jgi:4,5:9,10-diseco-3-hydroxy-5,9,17-trioxoandrosta-1(10),2-diene-4-oate hydrolase
MARVEAATTRPGGEGSHSDARTARKRLLAGIPVAERQLELGGVPTTVLEGGSGSPLILLHGGIECGGVYWGPVITDLADDYRLVVPDVPGLGESEPVARLDPGAFLRWFAALVQQTCDERPALVAHSLLGNLAPFAAQREELARLLVVYGAAGIGPYRIPLGLRAAAIRFDLRPSQRNQERFERWAFLDPEQTKKGDPGWFEAFDAYAVHCGRIRHVKRTMRYLIRTCTKRIPDAELQRIEVPVTLLWGRHDRMVPLRLAEDASSRLAWPLQVVDGAGHVPHMEQPAAFCDALRAALDAT